MIKLYAFLAALAFALTDHVIGLLIFERANRDAPDKEQMSPFTLATPGRLSELRRRYLLADPSGRLLHIRRFVRIGFIVAAVIMFWLVERD
jgi:hypothetical protein